MIPIHHLLNRIRWDPEFGNADIEIGYYDRMADRIVVVAIRQVDFSADNHFAIEVTDGHGESHMVPLHRIRQVFRNGLLIWARHRD